MFTYYSSGDHKLQNQCTGQLSLLRPWSLVYRWKSFFPSMCGGGRIYKDSSPTHEDSALMTSPNPVTF